MTNAGGNQNSSSPQDVFEIVFEAQNKSPTLREIWTSAYGDDYPVEADPSSFVTLTDLERFARELCVGPGHTFTDIGCGRGGPGLWVARKTHASLIGIDTSEVAVRHASNRLLGTDLVGKARFQRGDFLATALPEGSLIDAAMSADALLFAPDRAAACREVARILRPGTRFVFTTWELFQPSVSLGLDPIVDYRPLLEAAGFAVELYEETGNWEPRMQAVFAGIIAAEQKLKREMGEVAAALVNRWALTRPKELSDSRRVFGVGRRKGDA
jgi:SAM-dependent methyltransferase